MEVNPVYSIFVCVCLMFMVFEWYLIEVCKSVHQLFCSFVMPEMISIGIFNLIWPIKRLFMSVVLFRIYFVWTKIR